MGNLGSIPKISWNRKNPVVLCLMLCVHAQWDQCTFSNPASDLAEELQAYYQCSVESLTDSILHGMIRCCSFFYQTALHPGQNESYEV